MEFNIGQIVKVKNYDSIPDDMKKTFAKACGKNGVIVDKITSQASGTTTYKLMLDGRQTVSLINFPPETLEINNRKISYSVEINICDNVAVASLYEVDDDFGKNEIARGHGHIIHDGALGVAQATSYAFKRLYQKIAEN